jgi:hypothetical protein
LNSKRTKKLTAPAVILLLSASLSAQPPKATSPSAAKSHKVSHHSSKKARKPRGQMAIDGERASQIQAALVREHYMNGASGKWDDSTQAAMRRYQADQGWQSKSIPDSRALIRLGLGPDHVHLLNPESAMVSEPQMSAPTRTASAVAARPAAEAQTSNRVAVPATTMPNISPSR